MNETSYSHAYGESNYHIVFSPKYRHAIFDENDFKNHGSELKRFCEESFVRTAGEYTIRIRAMKVMPDHNHLFVSLKPDQSVSWSVHKFKGRSARELFKEFPWLKEFKPGEKRFWGGHLWSEGYFFRSVGSTTDEAVDFYIKVSQDKELRDKYYTKVGGCQEDPYVTFIKEQMRAPQMTLADFC